MVVVEKTYKKKADDVFENAIQTLLFMKSSIKYKNISCGLIIAFSESLVSYPSGELLILEINGDKESTNVKFSSESMALNSRLLKNMKNKKNTSFFIEILEKKI